MKNGYKQKNGVKVNKMKKLTKKDYLYMILNCVAFIILALILCEGTYLFGSTLDWPAQHITFPDYFRTLFYDTKDLLPDFALNIGSGQNIYNFSYYGLLSPIILISYLLPFVPMSTYISVSTIIMCLLSSVLMYLFLHKKKYSSEVCFMASFIFIMSTSISFQAHRHIMFINYMPFLILGLFGVDKKLDTGKGWLLTLSTFLMIMTSYYFSIGGIFCLFVYALYCYLNKMNIVTMKTFFKTFFSILIPILLAILCSSILTLPTLATIVNNRAASNVTITLKELLFPNLSLSNILYNKYGIGLTAILIPALINFFKKRKANLVLGLILIVLGLFNICNYILNGTMYIDAKSLIPFLPLYVYVIAEFLKDILEKKVNYKIVIPITLIISIAILSRKYYLYAYLAEAMVLLLAGILFYKKERKILFMIPILVTIFIVSLTINKSDALVLKENHNYQENLVKDNINLITEMDQDIYRISNNIDITETPNNIYGNIDYYNTTIYSSVSNQIYNKFYFDTITNNIPARNRALTVTNSNVLFQMLSGSKYIVSNNKALLGYETVSANNGTYIYKNENVFPIGFATKNIMSYEDFNKLSDQEKQEALLKVIVGDNKSSNDFVSNTKPIELDYQEIFTSSNSKFKVEEDGSISLETNEDIKVTYDLPKKYQNKIIFIRFKMNHSEKDEDLAIKINSVKNKLTASSWKYYNGNEVFDYVLASQEQTKLTFTFTKGIYNMSDFETYILDYANIETAVNNIDKLIVDKEKTKGDKIVGKVNVVEDGYFMFTIPYDHNFEIKVDNEKINYEKVDGSYIGFKITEGTHDISLEYHAPMKKISCIIAILGICLFAIVTFLEGKKKI